MCLFVLLTVCQAEHRVAVHYSFSASHWPNYTAGLRSCIEKSTVMHVIRFSPWWLTEMGCENIGFYTICKQLLKFLIRSFKSPIIVLWLFGKSTVFLSLDFVARFIMNQVLWCSIISKMANCHRLLLSSLSIRVSDVPQMILWVPTSSTFG